MDDISSVHLNLQQNAQRTAQLEELLRRNESSLAAALGRVKDLELGMNSFHKILQHAVSENQALSKELMNSRNKVEGVDRSWRSHVQQTEQGMWSEIRSLRQQQDPAVTRLVQEVTMTRAQMGDLEAALSRVSDAQNADTNAIRICEQHIQNAESQVAEMTALSRDSGRDAARRVETALRDLNNHKQEVDRAVNALKQANERQVREMSSTIEQHANSLSSFQGECGSALRTLREEVASGLSQAAASLKANEDSARTLEQILRAEVQMRGAAVTQLSTKLTAMDQAVSSKLGMVNTHNADITRLWDTIRAVNSQRAHSERLDNVLSSIGSGNNSPNNTIQHQPQSFSRADGGVNNSNNGSNIVSLDDIRLLESATSDRFDGLDGQVLQLAETLKRAHSGVEEQVDSLASRFGRLEMRLEQVASRRDDTVQQLQARFAAPHSLDGSDANAAADVMVKEVVDTRLRVDKLEANIEEVKFDISDLLDAISAETTDLHRRLESVEHHGGGGGGGGGQPNSASGAELPPRPSSQLHQHISHQQQFYPPTNGRPVSGDPNRVNAVAGGGVLLGSGRGSGRAQQNTPPLGTPLVSASVSSPVQGPTSPIAGLNNAEQHNSARGQQNSGRQSPVAVLGSARGGQPEPSTETQEMLERFAAGETNAI